MKLEELEKMVGGQTAAKEKRRRGFVSGVGRGRTNESTGHRGIHLRTRSTKTGSNRYQVHTKQAPVRYIGTAPTLEAALQLQAAHKAPPIPKSGIPGVCWATCSWRGRVVINGQAYTKSGFKSPADASQWIEEQKAKHAAKNL